MFEAFLRNVVDAGSAAGAVPAGAAAAAPVRTDPRAAAAAVLVP